MKKDILQRAKGVRDFGPEETIFRNELVDVLRKNFELFGFNPIETPVLERYELFASKYGAGDESDAMRETFKLIDQGGRKLVLRTEFTMPLARYIGDNPNLRLPFKRYQIGQVFRDGPLKLGRYREFWQCDADIVGSGADAELLNLAIAIFQKLGITIKIKLNNRLVLAGILEKAGVKISQIKSAIIAIDKLDKIGERGVTEELESAKIKPEAIGIILQILKLTGSNESLLEKIRSLIGDNEGLVAIQSLLNLVSDPGVVEFSPSLARGLAYYTGNVFEVFTADGQLTSAIAAGGRYDDMIGGLQGGANQIPAAGISFGLDTIFDALKLSGHEFAKKSVTKVYLTALDDESLLYGLKVVSQLRQAGINTDIDPAGKKLKKAMEYANAYGIPYVIIIGEDERQNQLVSLRNMASGLQESLTVKQVIDRLQ